MNREWIEELLSKTDIVGLISRYVKLEKKGNDYWGCCPFHIEKEPSFKIYTATDSYHCFGCKASGNAISFLSQIESIEWMDAIKLLAKDAGLQLPEYSKIDSEAIARLTKKKERLYTLLQSAARYYYDNLASVAGKSYKAYLNNRGIDQRLINKFGIGASLDWKGVVSHLMSQGFSETELKEAGVAEIGTDGAYDAYKGRVMFPIIDGFDKVVSFSGRIIEANAAFAKYKNGPTTPVFDKSKTLFGVNLLKKKKRTTGSLEYIILVEGHIDVVMMHAAGFDTTIASMGTALTYGHAKQIKNLCEKIYISYDGDSAGSKATLKGLDILASVGLNVRVVVLPEGKDPDDVVKEFGVDYYKGLLLSAQTLTEYKINSLKKQFDLGDVDGKSKFAINAVKIIKQLDAPIEREQYFGQISQITGYTMNALKEQARLNNEEARQQSSVSVQKNEQAFDEAAIYVLAYAAAGMEIPFGIDPTEFLTDDYIEIYVQIRQGRQSALYSLFPEQSVLIGEILNYSKPLGKKEFEGYVSHLLKEYLINKKQGLSQKGDERISQGASSAEIKEILDQIKLIDERLKNL